MNELRDIIEKHVKIISSTTRSRLLRERMFIKNNPVLYKRKLAEAQNVEKDITDNLVKMALHIVKEADDE